MWIEIQRVNHYLCSGSQTSNSGVSFLVSWQFINVSDPSILPHNNKFEKPYSLTFWWVKALAYDEGLKTENKSKWIQTMKMIKLLSQANAMSFLHSKNAYITIQVLSANRASSSALNCLS